MDRVTDGWQTVVIVDKDDRPLGLSERWLAHQPPGMLHRAFSVAVFNTAGQLLLQRRAVQKRTFPGRWSNTCCGHAQEGIDITISAARRLKEEMGIDVLLQRVGTFRYQSLDAASGLVEHEITHILTGHFEGSPDPCPDESSDWVWESPDELHVKVDSDPARYTPWLGGVMQLVVR